MDKQIMGTGCDLIDLLIGGAKGVYGIPFGYIVNLIGDKSAGKTFLKNEILAFNYYKYKNKFKWISDDGESGDTFNTEKLYGVKLASQDHHIGKVTFNNSQTVEEMCANSGIFMDSLKDGEVAIYAEDSLDGLSDAADLDGVDELENQMKLGKDVKESGSYNMGKQKFLSKFFRTKEKDFYDKNCTLLIVSQIRDKIGAMGYGPKWTVAGGKALEFYCHTRIFLTTKKKIMNGDRCIGAYVTAKTIKSKTARPFREVGYSVFFDRGIDNVGSNIDYLFDLRGDSGDLLSKAKALNWGGAEVNLENVTKFIEGNGLRESYNAYCDSIGKQHRINTEIATDWGSNDADVKEKWAGYFGKTMTRDELRQLCQNSREDRLKLRDLVRAKWEAAEDEACAAVGFEKQFDF